MGLWTRFRRFLAWWRGATVLTTPKGDGYAAYKGSDDGFNNWADSLIAAGWKPYYPFPRKEAS